MALLLILSQLIFYAPSVQAAPVVKRPKLVIMLVIDQFRADYLLRFENRFLPPKVKGGDVGGFGYLMNQGAYFPMAEYGILHGMTCPGHATILTGAYPYQMGIALNGWTDPVKGEYRYCAEDETFSTVGGPHQEHMGVAPTHLNGTTVGDELKNAGLPSRVVAVALKDRAAIMLGGHRADLAFWMHPKERAWVSSKFYLPDGKLPEWLVALNRKVEPKAGQKIRWELGGQGTGLSEPGYTPPKDVVGDGKSFPYEIAASEKVALALPYGMELTIQAAETALDAMKLGRGAGPDMLAISLSSHDYLGHAFGPNSREMEEMTIQEDRLISRLLNHVRKKVPGGLSQVVVALTADHGSPPDPVWAKTKRIDAGFISEKPAIEEFEKILNEKFGTPAKSKWVLLNHDLNIYVSRKAVTERKADLGAVLALIKERFATMPGIAYAFTALDYEARKLPPGVFGEQAMRTYIPGRSGDVVGIAKPFWMIQDGDTVSHMTSYSYDRMVPLLIAGPGLRAARHPAHVRVIDLAPTLSHLLGVLPPSNSEGRVLTEALVTGGTQR